VGIPVGVTLFRSSSKNATPSAPAFYAEPAFLKRPRLKEWWTLLHPPYTALHLSYVAIGTCLVAPVNAVWLVMTLLAFFLGVGVGAHALDELMGRPLSTTIPTWQLIAASVVGLGGAVALGVVGAFVVSPYLVLFIAVGVLIALGYNLELFGGRLHTDAVFALGWGGFPVLTAYFAQHATLSVAAFLTAAFAAFTSQAQRQLSTPARDLRRRTSSLEGTQVYKDGTIAPVTSHSVLAPLERALHSICWASSALAIGLVWLRFGPH
jgi:hypothetical protein